MKELQSICSSSGASLLGALFLRIFLVQCAALHRVGQAVCSVAGQFTWR